jgi:hypothetical protein
MSPIATKRFYGIIQHHYKKEPEFQLILVLLPNTYNYEQKKLLSLTGTLTEVR